MIFTFTVICIACVKGPTNIFGPRAPQSLNPALIRTYANIYLYTLILFLSAARSSTNEQHIHIFISCKKYKLTQQWLKLLLVTQTDRQTDTTHNDNTNDSVTTRTQYTRRLYSW